MNLNADAITAAKTAAYDALAPHIDDDATRRRIADTIVQVMAQDTRTPTGWYMVATDKDARADVLRRVLAATRGDQFAVDRRAAADRAIVVAATALAHNTAI